MEIICYQLNRRPQINNIEKKLYKLTNKEYPQRFLGPNLSFFIFKKENLNIMVMFDSDDCSGWHERSFKMDNNNFKKIKNKYSVSKIILFKNQYSNEKTFNQFNPYQNITFPIGYMPDDLNSISYINDTKEKNIDFFWVGNTNIGSLKDKEYDKKYYPNDWDWVIWPPGMRRNIFNKLKDIEKNNGTWNCVFSNQKIEFKKYLDLIKKSKICIDIPGVGYNTKRFIELLKMGKPCLTYKSPLIHQFKLIEDKHYFKYSTMEELEDKMKFLLDNPEKLKNTEEELKKINDWFTYDYIIDYIKEIINN